MDAEPRHASIANDTCDEPECVVCQARRADALLAKIARKMLDSRQFRPLCGHISRIRQAIAQIIDPLQIYEDFRDLKETFDRSPEGRAPQPPRNPQER